MLEQVLDFTGYPSGCSRCKEAGRLSKTHFEKINPRTEYKQKLSGPNANDIICFHNGEGAVETDHKDEEGWVTTQR